jgi:hypothetical protein
MKIITRHTFMCETCKQEYHVDIDARNCETTHKNCEHNFQYKITNYNEIWLTIERTCLRCSKIYRDGIRLRDISQGLMEKLFEEAEQIDG